MCFTLFGTLRRILKQCLQSTVEQRMAVLETSRIEIFKLRSSNILGKKCSSFTKQEMFICAFVPYQKVLCHRKTLHGDAELVCPSADRFSVWSLETVLTVHLKLLSDSYKLMRLLYLELWLLDWSNTPFKDNQE